MLWASLALVILDGYSDPQAWVFPDRPAFTWAMHGVMVVIYGLNAVLIHFTARGRIWARLLILACTALGVLVAVGILDEVPELPTLTQAGLTVLDVTATAMLFFGEGGRWYREVRAARAGSAHVARVPE